MRGLIRRENLAAAVKDIAEKSDSKGYQGLNFNCLIQPIVLPMSSLKYYDLMVCSYIAFISNFVRVVVETVKVFISVSFLSFLDAKTQLNKS